MCSGSDRRGVFKKGQRWKRVSPAPGWVSSLVGEGMIVANGWCGNSLDFPGQSWSSPWETRKRSCESVENPCGLQSTGCRVGYNWSDLAWMHRQLKGAVSLGCEWAADGGGYTEGSECYRGLQPRVCGDCAGMTGGRWSLDSGQGRGVIKGLTVSSEIE